MDVAATPLTGEMIASEARVLPRTPSNTSQEGMRRLAEEFEAMAIAEMLQPMFAAIDPRGLGGGGAGEEMFRPMLVQQYADAMAKAGGIGLADAVVRELVRLQSVVPAEAATPGEPTETAIEETHGADR